MTEPKLILKVELINNKMKVSLGTQHEALLALALRKAEMTFYDCMLSHDIEDEPQVQQSSIVVPESIIKSL